MNSCSYIAIEGIDGAGKTTLSSLLAERLLVSPLTPVRLAEPTRSSSGLKAIERVSVPLGERDVELERRLFTADRLEHVKDRINPLLGLIEAGAPFVILQDRYYLSAPAYQSRTVSELLPLLHEQQALAPRPDLVILLDVPAETAVQRVVERDGGLSSRQNREILSQVRDNYLTLSKETSERIEVIDVSLASPEAICDQVLRIAGLLD